MNSAGTDRWTPVTSPVSYERCGLASRAFITTLQCQTKLSHCVQLQYRKFFEAKTQRLQRLLFFPSHSILHVALKNIQRPSVIKQLIPIFLVFQNHRMSDFASRAPVVALIRAVGSTQGLEDDDIYSALLEFETVLRKSVKKSYTRPEMEMLCETLHRFGVMLLLQTFARRALERRPEQTVFVFHALYAKANGMSFKLNERDFANSTTPLTRLRAVRILWEHCWRPWRKSSVGDLTTRHWTMLVNLRESPNPKSALQIP